MAEREMKMPEKKISKDTEEQNGIMPSQRQRPESGRYLLQIDRQIAIWSSIHRACGSRLLA